MINELTNPKKYKGNILTIEELNRITNMLVYLHDETAKVQNTFGNKAVAGSKAILESTSYSRPESVMTALSQGNTLVEVAADQLIAFTKTLTVPIQTIAPWTCARSLLEACALASWLFDSQISVETRIQRSLAFRYEGLSQQLKFGKAIGEDTIKVVTRIEAVEDVAVSLGFPKIHNSKGKRTGIAQNMPTVTEIIASTLNEESSYRLLSAIAHGHHWALQQLSFTSIEKDEVKILEKNLSPTCVSFLSLKSALAFSKSVWLKSHYFGFDISQLNRVFETAFDELGATGDDFRFWRLS